MQDEISLYESLQIIKKRRALIAIMITVFLLIGCSYLLTTPKIYRAESVILPLGSEGKGNLNVLANMAEKFSLGGGGSSTATPSQKLQIVLQSYTFAEQVARNAEVQNKYREIFLEEEKKVDPRPLHERLASTINRFIKVRLDEKFSVLRLFTDTPDPDFSTFLNKVAVAELQTFLNQITLSEAKKHRLYIGQQLIASKQELLEAGKQMTSFYQQNKISSISPFVDVDVSIPDFMAKNAPPTPLNSQLINESDRLKNLDEQIANRLTGIQVKDVPEQIYFQYLGQRKQILFSINGLLSQQYETAKMEESRDDVSFQIIDPARKPGSVYRPRAVLILLVSALSGLIMGLFAVFAVEYWSAIKKP